MSASPLTVTAPQLRPPFRYIAIEGPIGVGKTSLARRLADRWSMHPLFERPQDNPFLERFYRDTSRYALATQLHFALQRAHQAQEVAAVHAAGTPLIADFMTQKNDIFAPAYADRGRVAVISRAGCTHRCLHEHRHAARFFG